MLISSSLLVLPGLTPAVLCLDLRAVVVGSNYPNACTWAIDLCCGCNAVLRSSVPLWDPKHDFGWYCLRVWLAVFPINLAFSIHFSWFLVTSFCFKWFLMDFELSVIIHTVHLYWVPTQMCACHYCRCCVLWCLFLRDSRFYICYSFEECQLVNYLKYLIT